MFQSMYIRSRRRNEKCNQHTKSDVQTTDMRISNESIRKKYTNGVVLVLKDIALLTQMVVR